MLLVVGATGDLGGQVARRLLDAGRRVRVLVRDGSAYEPLVAAGAETVVGDLKDRASLDAACHGVEAVVTTANSAARGGDDTPQTVDLEGNRNLIDAARAAGAGRFVFTSVLVPDIWRAHPFMAAKLETDAYLQRSGLEHAILRPTMFMDSWVGFSVLMPLQGGGPAIVPGQGLRKHSFVAAVDVARLLVAAVDHPAATNEIIDVGGPEPVSWSDVVRQAEAIIGDVVPVHHLTADDPAPGLPPDFAAMLMATEQFDSVVDMADTATMFGVELTTVDQFLRSGLPPSS